MYPSPAETEDEPETVCAHILIVDDDPEACRMLQRALETQHTVTLAGSGAEALHLLEHDAFDAVLLDIMLPDMDGLAVLQAIRRRPKTADLPVLLISGLIDSATVAHGLKLGANDYISKPFDTSITLARVETQVTLRRLREEHEATLQRYEATETMQHRLFRVATHDLKNPLANIRMAEYVLREAVAGDPVAVQMMETVTASLDAMQDVLDDFMNVIVLQRGQIELTIKPTSVERTVYRTLLQYNVNAEKKGISVQADDISGEVLADEARLGQIITNLVSNAIKFSPTGTCITLATTVHGDWLRFSISDQGPGIPENERHLLFTEFGKLSPRPTGQESSTGLGLWIVRTLTELMGGSVGVQNIPGGGATFWVDLPLACQQPVAEPQTSIIPFPVHD